MPATRKTAHKRKPTRDAQGTWLRLLCLPALRACSERTSGKSGSLLKAPPAGMVCPSPFSKSDNWEGVRPNLCLGLKATFCKEHIFKQSRCMLLSAGLYAAMKQMQVPLLCSGYDLKTAATRCDTTERCKHKQRRAPDDGQSITTVAKILPERAVNLPSMQQQTIKYQLVKATKL